MSWHLRFGKQCEEKTALYERCVKDRNALLEKLSILPAVYEGTSRAEMVEAVLTDVCGFSVIDRPLSRGQMAVCDFRRKRVTVNSDLSFIDKKADQTLFRWSTLAHELGHVRLHADEMAAGIFVSHHSLSGLFSDSRSFQREREADLYAGAFLVCQEKLREDKGIQKLLDCRENGRKMWNKSLWGIIYRVARLQKVSPALMKRCLCDFGWIQQKSRSKSGFETLALKYHSPE